MVDPVSILIGVGIGVIIAIAVIRSLFNEIERLNRRIDGLDGKLQVEANDISKRISSLIHTAKTTSEKHDNMIRSLDSDRNYGVRFQTAVEKVLKLDLPKAVSYANQPSSPQNSEDEDGVMRIRCECGQFTFSDRNVKLGTELGELALRNGWSVRTTTEGTFWYCRGCTNARKQAEKEATDQCA